MDDLAVHQIMGDALIAQGHMTPEAVAADRAAIEAGVDPAAPALSTPAATQPPTQANPVDPMSAAAFEGPASPAAYQFEHLQGVQSDPQIERAMRNFFHSEGIPVPIAKQMNTMFTKAALNPPSEAQLAQSKQTALASLGKAWGADTQKNLDLANREIDRMENALPDLKAQLLQTGMGNDPWLIQTIFNMAKAKGRG